MNANNVVIIFYGLWMLYCAATGKKPWYYGVSKEALQSVFTKRGLLALFTLHSFVVLVVCSNYYKNLIY